MCYCTPSIRTPCCKNCPYEMQIKWGFINDRQGNKSMNFSEALVNMKLGIKCYREGWNGKGMFVYLVHGSKFEVNRAPLNAVFEMGAKVTYRPHLDLKAVDGTCGVWTPCNSDLLADDWLNVVD